MSSELETTAWHEAGHAFMAVHLGGEVISLSIDPDFDDGPKRFGDVQIQWRGGQYSQRQMARNEILVALAGPVAEMIHLGDPFHPATVAEWSQDWKMAWKATSFLKSNREKMQFLERTTVELHQTLSQGNHWAGIGALVDHLLAYEVLEGETVHEIVDEWR